MTRRSGSRLKARSTHRRHRRILGPTSDVADRLRSVDPAIRAEPRGRARRVAPSRKVRLLGRVATCGATFSARPTAGAATRPPVARSWVVVSDWQRGRRAPSTVTITTASHARRGPARRPASRAELQLAVRFARCAQRLFDCGEESETARKRPIEAPCDHRAGDRGAVDRHVDPELNTSRSHTRMMREQASGNIRGEPLSDPELDVRGRRPRVRSARRCRACDTRSKDAPRPSSQ